MDKKLEELAAAVAAISASQAAKKSASGGKSFVGETQTDIADGGTAQRYGANG